MTQPYTVGTLLVSDSFNRSDSSSIGSTDGGSLGSLTWQTDSGASLSSWEILSNSCASNASPSIAAQVAWVDCGESNVRVQIEIAQRPGNPANIGIVTRLVSRGSCHWFGDDQATGHKLYLQRRTSVSDSGSTNIIAGVGSISAGTTITLDCWGSGYFAYINGTLVATGTDTYNETATKVGLWNNKDAIGAVDDFKVWELSPVLGGGAYQFRRGRRAHIAGARGVSIQGR